MKKTLFAILLCFLLSSAVYGQSDRYLSFELAGSGGIGSLNFEKTLYQKDIIGLNFRLGFSLTPIDKNNGIVLIFPIMIHTILGRSAHKLDLGIGQSISITTRGSGFLLMPLSIGYRFQPQEKNYYLRVAYTPIVSYLLDFQWQHWVGITYGYKLNNRK